MDEIVTRETYPKCPDCGRNHRPAVRYCPAYRAGYMREWRARKVTISRNEYLRLIELAQPERR